MRGDATVAVEPGPQADGPAVSRVRDLQLVGVAQLRAHRSTGRAREEHQGVLVE